MKESRSNQPESGEINQQQAQEFTDEIERINSLFGTPFSFTGEEAPADEPVTDWQAEFIVDDLEVRVFVGEIKYDGVDRKAWSVFLDAADTPEMYLQEQFEVSKDRSGVGLSLSYSAAIQQWDDPAKRYTSLHSSQTQEIIREVRSRLEDGERLSDSSNLMALIESVANDPDQEIETATGLDMSQFTPERFDRIMGVLSKCNADTLRQ
jgi:hypothetical protein